MTYNWQEKYIKNAGEHETFARNVAKWTECGYTNPGLCFAWLEHGIVKGGIVFSAEDSEIKSILDFSLSLDSFHLGAELLNESLKRVSARHACYHLYNDSDQYSHYMQCFIDAGFYVSQEKLSYRFTDQTLAEKAERVTFHSFSDAGEKEFNRAVALVTQQTLDRVDAAEVAKHGQPEAAETLVNELKEIDFQPDIWMLAYNGGSLIGLVIPSNLGDAYGAINYIGVVPTARGKGYVDDLLSKGTQLLLSQGVTTVIADIDVNNFPMKYALERIGYKFSQDEVVLEKVLQI